MGFWVYNMGILDVSKFERWTTGRPAGLFAADWEGFGIDLEFLPLLATYFGGERVREITYLTQQGLNGGKNGELTKAYEEWLKLCHQRIERIRGVPKSYALDMVNKAKLNKGIPEVYDIARRLNYFNVIISHGPSILINKFVEETNIDLAYSNDLIFRKEDEFEALDDIAIKVGDKGEELRRLQESLDIPEEKTVVVGDGRTDATMFKHGVSAAFRPVSKYVEEEANVVIFSPREIIPVLMNPERYRVLRGFRLTPTTR